MRAVFAILQTVLVLGHHPKGECAALKTPKAERKMLERDPFDDPGLNAHRNDLARKAQEESGENFAGILGLVFKILVAGFPIILPSIILQQLWPECPPQIATFINLSAYLVIIYVLARTRIFGTLPIVGSGVLLIVSAIMTFYFKRGQGDFYATVGEPIIMAVLGVSVLAYYFLHVRPKYIE